MSENVHMPKLGETMTRGTVLKWLAREGDAVQRDEALVLIEAVARLIPGVIGTPRSHESDSFSDPRLLDHPHFTRPRVFRGMEVPQVLLSGDHAKIERWRRDAAREKTRRNRPDLLRD